MVPCAQCTHNPMMLWLSVAFIEYTEYHVPGIMYRYRYEPAGKI